MPDLLHLKTTLSAGSGLIEVAVSLLVISVATLGLAGLQISAKSLGYQASQRAEAIVLAGDLLERMRGNRSALSRYAVTEFGAASDSVLPDPAVDCGDASCSAIELSEWDLWQWERSVNGVAQGNEAGGLLNPLACVTVSGRLVTVAIAWEGLQRMSDPGAGDGCGTGEYGAGDGTRQRLELTSFIGDN